MTGPGDDLEVTYHWVSITIVVLFSTAFAAGLILYVIAPASRVSAGALEAGLLLLIASPVARMTISTAERIRRRDWIFVLMAIAVVVELAIVLWRAAAKV